MRDKRMALFMKESVMELFDIQEELKKLPKKSGVYLMKGADGEIIYVGKAVNLSNRVRQYFQSSANHSLKVRKMVPHIKEFEYVVTDNEIEALILECNLIKKNAPKYNVMLKDDKAYPYLKLTVQEPFPRVLLARRHEKDKAKYFGPFTNQTALRESLDLIRGVWPLRSCSRKLPQDIGKERPCLNYHIKKCKAPCAGLISEQEYHVIVDEVIQFLSGRHAEILSRLENEMADYAQKMEFERAADLRDTISAVRVLSEKQKIDHMAGENQDVVAFARAFDDAVVQVFFIRGGQMTGREHFMLNRVEHLSRSEVMTEFIKQFYAEAAFVPKELILEEEILDREVILQWLAALKGHSVMVTVPQRGDKRSLVEMASKNAGLMLQQFGEHLKREKAKTEGALNEIRQALGISQVIRRIEAYDISNIQGYESVGSMVVFEQGKPKNSDYRKFKIKSVIGADDYASMEEVIRRRFTRYQNELAEKNQNAKFLKLPDILFMDGGKGQIHAAQNALQALGMNIPVCGMIKDDRHRTRGLLYEGREVLLPPTTEGFKLVTRIQDEAHRFAVEYHRKLRASAQVHSILDDIEGIGPARRKALLRHFKSIENIKNASVTELANISGMNRAAGEAVHRFFHVQM